MPDPLELSVAPSPPRRPTLARPASPAAGLAAAARRWARSPSALALLGGWLVWKQLLFSPLHENHHPLTPGMVAASAAVALITIGIAGHLRGRAQLVALLALDAALSGLHQVHVLYERQFFELASVADLSFAWQTEGVRGSVLALLHGRDVLLWVDVAVLACAAALGAARAPLPRVLAGALVIGGAALFGAPALPLLDRPLTGPRRLGVARAEIAAQLNVAGYEVFDLVAFARQRVDHSSAGSARESLARSVAYHRERAAPSGPLTGSQRGRDVIVIHLESTQRSAVGLSVEGTPVTPNLDALARESIAFRHAFTQVGQGTSSDAELLTTCSLYPLAIGAAFTERYDVKYRCLPELLRDAGYRTVAMHANWPNFWNRERMYPALGYQRFLSISDFDRTPVIGLGLSDERFFEQAVERLRETPEPFYATLVMLSNHAPYDDPRVPRALPLGPLRGTYLGAYLDSVHLADAAIGRLVDRLRATGLLDRSVLVVYGDHAGVSRNATGTSWLELPTRRADVWLRHELEVPLLVRLPGGRHAQLRDDPAGQVDVAPTIADLLGIPADTAFFHGRSLVSEAPRPVIEPDGSAVTDALVWMGPEAKWGPTACVDAPSGERLPPERCAALAAYAARELAISRGEVNHDLFRWMTPPRSPGEEPLTPSGSRAPSRARPTARSRP